MSKLVSEFTRDRVNGERKLCLLSLVNEVPSVVVGLTAVPAQHQNKIP